MASGVAIDDSSVSTFNELKLGHSYRYIIFKITDTNDKIVVDKTAAPSASYADFVNDLPKDECRYAVFDLAYQSEDGSDRNKLVYIQWSPDVAKIKNKMLYTSSNQDLRRALVGIAVGVQATDAAEIDEAAIVDKVKRTSNK